MARMLPLSCPLPAGGGRCDRNGRIGRLWQTLILSRWRLVFAWMPTETLIRRHQIGYYAALRASRQPVIDAASFIDYMFGVITESLGHPVLAGEVGQQH